MKQALCHWWGNPKCNWKARALPLCEGMVLFNTSVL